MKLNQIFFGLLVMCIVAVKVGLSPSAPVLVMLIAALLLPIFDIAINAVKAVYGMAVYANTLRESFKKPANSLTIREDLAALKKVLYKDESITYILNDRSAAYEKLFVQLKGIDSEPEFDLQSFVAFGNSQQIVHQIKAKNPSATRLLTGLKNKLLAESVDLEFS